jgi:hypothetical protein
VQSLICRLVPQSRDTLGGPFQADNQELTEAKAPESSWRVVVVHGCQVPVAGETPRQECARGLGFSAARFRFCNGARLCVVRCGSRFLCTLYLSNPFFQLGNPGG